MASKTQHVIPHNGKWAVKGEGNSRVTSVHDSKQEAIDTARKIARSQSGSLYIHGRSGQILLRSDASSSIRDDKVRAAVRDNSVQSTRSAAKKIVKKSSGKVRQTSNN